MNWNARMRNIFLLSLLSILASCGGGSGGGGSKTGDLTMLNSIEVSPTVLTVTNGGTANLTVKGINSNGTTTDLTASLVTWEIAASGVAVASVVNGTVTAKTVGDTTVIANFKGHTSHSDIKVTDATLSSIAITPASNTLSKGTNVNLIATGTYSDGNTADITTQVTWASSAPDIATIGAHTGSVYAAAVGSTSISATLGAITNTTPASITVTNATLSGIVITPDPTSIPKGTSAKLKATGLYSDNYTADITTQVSWTSAAPATVAVGANTGIVVGNAIGNAAITATLGKTSQSVSVTVTSAMLTSIAIAPAPVSLPKGTSTQLTASGTYSDNTVVDLTSKVVWRTDSLATASIEASTGKLVGNEIGNTTVYATLGNTAQSVGVSVTTAALSSIAITPVSSSLAKGASTQLSATGIFTDNTATDITTQVTWISAAPSVLAVGLNTGIAVGSAIGTTTVTATLNGKTSPAATVTVTAFNFTRTISTNTLNYNLTTDAIAAAWDQVAPLNASVTINSGVVVGSSSTATYAFIVPSLPAGSTVTIINNGYISGAGGDGGGGGAYAGAPGGPALSVFHTTTIVNNGTIQGGGGGGGETFFAANQGAGCMVLSMGGGGGAGSIAGVGGSGNTLNGGNGSLLVGGVVANSASPVGGGPGQVGMSGGSIMVQCPGPSAGGAGGAAGAATLGNANITWSVAGTRLGALN